jgi:hypothetical protein
VRFLFLTPSFFYTTFVSSKIKRAATQFKIQKS